MPKHLGGIGLAALALCLGSALSIVATSDTPVCSGNLCSADIAATATTSGSTAAAAILVSVDGGQIFANVGTVATTDWAGSGRAKLAEEVIPITDLPAGATTVVTVCFMQPGANGNPLKRACADVPVTTPGACPPGAAVCGPPRRVTAAQPAVFSPRRHEGHEELLDRRPACGRAARGPAIGLLRVLRGGLLPPNRRMG